MSNNDKCQKGGEHEFLSICERDISYVNLGGDWMETRTKTGLRCRKCGLEKDVEFLDDPVIT